MSLPSDTPNWFDSTETGAPVLNNAVGSQLALLIAAAVNGFNVKTVSQIEVASGVATATCAAHGYSASFGKLIAIAGAPAPALNGNHRIGDVTTNTFTFPAAGVADGIYTGSIDARRAPLGWSVAYANVANTVAILQRTAAEASGALIRINDSHADGSTANDSRVVMVESATDVDTYTAPGPTAAALSGGQYWPKGRNNTGAKKWVVVGCDRGFWFFSDPYESSEYLSPCCFFDIVSHTAPDAYRAMLVGGHANSNTGFGNSVGGRVYSVGSNPSQHSSVLSRDVTGSGGAVAAFMVGPGTNSTMGGVGAPVAGAAVAVSAGLFVQELLGTKIIRGAVPGVLVPLNKEPFANLVPQYASDGSGRVLLPVLISSLNVNGQMAFELAAPWY